MATATNPYVVFVLYLLAILGFVGFTLFLNRMLGPKPVASAVKREPFECGATLIDSVNVRAVPIKYYAVAIAFLLFDLETVLLFVWVGSFGPRELAMISLFSFLFFMAVLALVFVYLWKEGAFEWR